MNKKGFTLVEVLVTIVIIGIISTIGVVTYNSIIKSRKQKLKDAEIKLIETAAIKYGEAHKTEVNKGYEILLDGTTLEKYEDDLSGNDNINTSSISVGALKYLGYLSDIDSKEEKIETEDLDISDGDKVYMYLQNNKVYASYNENVFDFNFSFEDDIITIKIDDSKEKEDNKTKNYDYSYVVYINDSENVSGNLTNKEEEITLDTAKYPTFLGDVYIATVVLTGKSDDETITLKKSREIQIEQTDEIGCYKVVTVSDSEEADYDYKWTNKNVRLYNECNDTLKDDDGNEVSTGSGILKYEYTEDGENKSGELTLDSPYIEFDKEGKYEVKLSHDKERSNLVIKIDKTSPTINVEVYASDESNANATKAKEYAVGYNLLKKDLESNIVENEYFDNLVNQWYNAENFKDGVAYKFNGTDTKSGISEIIWKENDGGIYRWVDNDSVDSYLTNESSKKLINKKVNVNNEIEIFKRLKDEGIRYAKLILKDEAGNESEILVRPNIDRTAPDVAVSKEYKVDYQDTKYNQSSNYEFTDSGSGFEFMYTFTHVILDIKAVDKDNKYIDFVQSKAQYEFTQSDELSTWPAHSATFNIYSDCSKTSLIVCDRAGNCTNKDSGKIDDECYNNEEEDVPNEEEEEQTNPDPDPDETVKKLTCPKITSTVKPKTWTQDNITFTFDFTNTNATKYDWYTNTNGNEFEKWEENKVATTTKTITGVGKRKIKLVLKDDSGNTLDCLNGNKEYWIDKAAPTITLDVYKNNSKNEKTGSSIKNLKNTDYTNNNWLNNADYPDGIGFNFTIKDDVNLAKYTWKYNSDQSVVKSFDKISYYDSSNGNISGTTYTKYLSLTGQGYRKATLTVKDESGKSSSVTVKVKMDRTAPTVPKVTMQIWNKDNTSHNTTYTANTWKNRNIYTSPSSTDAISGVTKYIVSYTPGDTNKNTVKDLTDLSKAYKNVNVNGTSYIKYRACDEAGNCSENPKNPYVIKIDKTNPTIKCSKSNTHSTTGVTVNISASDTGGSGLKTYTKKHTNVKNGTHKYTVYDNAGNSASCSITVTKVNQTRYRTRAYVYNSCADAACGGSNLYITNQITAKYVCTSYNNQHLLSQGVYFLTVNDKYCNYKCHGQAVTKYCSIVKKTKITYQTCHTAACGYASFGGWSAWSGNSCAATNLKQCQTRTVYY